MKNKLKNLTKDMQNKFILIGVMFLPLSLFGAEDTDFQTVSKPIILLGKLVVLIMGLAYLAIGTMWIWLPFLVAIWIKKHYEKKFEDRGEENSRDMLQKMLMGMLGSAILSFVVIGALGMIFFSADSLTNGISAYYGDILTNIKTFISQAFGIGQAQQ